MDLSRWFFRFAYLVGFKPWDSGVPPPELVAVVEGPSALPAGRALDLGCGTGTNVVYLARQGWDVIGIDFTPRALAAARRKVAAAGVKAGLLQGDVTRLVQLGVKGPFELFLDLGCFHGIPADRRAAYARGVAAAAAPGATFLMFAFAAPAGIRPWISVEDVKRTFNSDFEVEAQPAEGEFSPVWYRMRRRASAAKPPSSP